MRYKYPELTVTVPSSLPLSPPPSPGSTDPIQDFLQRRSEARKNKAKYRLTETDCSLLSTNSTELTFSSGQVVSYEGAIIQSVYRIKSGSLSLIKGGTKLYDLSPGFFIGEGIFIRGAAHDSFGASLIANGPVILTELNLPFVRQLLAVDKVLAMKVYRYIAIRLSILLNAVIPPTAEAALCASLISRTRSDSAWSNSSSGEESFFVGVGSDVVVVEPGTRTSLSSSAFVTMSSSSGGGGGGGLPNGERSLVMSGDVASTRQSKTKKIVSKLSPKKEKHFKKYQLCENTTGQEAKLYASRLIVTNKSKFVPGRKIKYNQILDMAKAAKNSVTIIYGVQAKTLFFKDETEMNEFFGIVQAHVISCDELIPKSSPSSAPPRSPNLTSNAQQINRTTHDTHDTSFCPVERNLLTQHAFRKEFVKGEYVFEEGDLYQRVWTLLSGQLHMKRGDHTMLTIEPGEVFGVVSLFHLRPYVVSIEVVSDTASLLVIPYYKIQELINSNFPLAVRMHKKAAQVLYSQIERVLMSRDGFVKGYGGSFV